MKLGRKRKAEDEGVYRGGPTPEGVPPLPRLFQKRCLYCDKIINHLPGEVCTECTLRGRDTEAITVDVGPGTYSSWRLPDGRTANFTPVVMPRAGQLVITVPKFAEAEPVPDTLTLTEAQQMLDDVKRQFEWDSSIREGRKAANKYRTASARQVDLAPPNPIRRKGNADA